MIVHKFGGTSVGDAGCFANVADIVVKHYDQEGRSESPLQVLCQAVPLLPIHLDGLSSSWKPNRPEPWLATPGGWIQAPEGLPSGLRLLRPPC